MIDDSKGQTASDPDLPAIVALQNSIYATHFEFGTHRFDLSEPIALKTYLIKARPKPQDWPMTLFKVAQQKVAELMSNDFWSFTGK